VAADSGDASRSLGGWAAGALLYSGRPDPSWPIADGANLWRRLAELAPCAGAIPDEGRLGYRGVWLRSTDGRRWRVFQHAAWLVGEAGLRRDVGRALEREILATAPAGLVDRESIRFD
jgi:hypothetical protein